MIFTDPRLMVHCVSPDGSPLPAQADWDGNAWRYRIHALGTRTLGYVWPESVRAEHGGVRTEHHATDRDDVELGIAATLEDAAAIVVAAAHA